MKRTAALSIALGGLAVVACQVVAGIEHVDKQQRGVALDASDTETGPTVADASDPCAHVRPPPPPANDDAPAEEIPPFYLALKTIKLIPNVRPEGSGLRRRGRHRQRRHEALRDVRATGVRPRQVGERVARAGEAGPASLRNEVQRQAQRPPDRGRGDD
jgi:hypothetical protein